MLKILITGTTQGIGKAVFDRLFGLYDVYTINRIHTKNNNNYYCDLSDIEQVNDLCNIIKNNDWDVLINNAGGDLPCRIENLTSKDLVNSAILNYITPTMLMQAVIPSMKKKKSGRIINISSIASKSPRLYLAQYGASKSALEAITRSMALYYSQDGIRINCICPGGINTPTSVKNRQIISSLMGKTENYRQEQFTNTIGSKLLLSPNVIVDFIEYLISQSGDAISGQCINICGVSEVH